MAVTAAMVKELREMTGAGMMDCKKALAATDGDMDKAVEFLREKGLAGATKKAGRIAAEGIVMTKVTADEKKAVRYLCQHRQGTTQYGVTTYRKLKVLSNFRIRESFEGKNIGHYLIDGITEKEAKNAFSNYKDV